MRNGRIIANNPKVKVEKAAPGMFQGTVKLTGDHGAHMYHFIFTVEIHEKGEPGWEHVSVSRIVGDKLPGWTEMCELKDIFWKDEEECVQIHPKKSEYVNLKSNCLHIWRHVPKDEWEQRMRADEKQKEEPAEAKV